MVPDPSSEAPASQEAPDAPPQADGFANAVAHEGAQAVPIRAWRLSVFAGLDRETGRQRYVHETVHARNEGARSAL
jgi:hypothetical protein